MAAFDPRPDPSKPKEKEKTKKTPPPPGLGDIVGAQRVRLAELGISYLAARAEAAPPVSRSPGVPQPSRAAEGDRAVRGPAALSGVDRRRREVAAPGRGDALADGVRSDPRSGARHGGRSADPPPPDHADGVPGGPRRGVAGRDRLVVVAGRRAAAAARVGHLGRGAAAASPAPAGRPQRRQEQAQGEAHAQGRGAGAAAGAPEGAAQAGKAGGRRGPGGRRRGGRQRRGRRRRRRRGGRRAGPEHRAEDGDAPDRQGALADRPQRGAIPCEAAARARARAA